MLLLLQPENRCLDYWYSSNNGSSIQSTFCLQNWRLVWNGFLVSSLGHFLGGFLAPHDIWTQLRLSLEKFPLLVLLCRNLYCISCCGLPYSFRNLLECGWRTLQWSWSTARTHWIWMRLIRQRIHFDLRDTRFLVQSLLLMQTQGVGKSERRSPSSPRSIQRNALMIKQDLHS